MEVAIQVSGLKKSYAGQPILDNLSLSVDRGKIYGLVGASGCGKTTLLSCILGLKSWDEGDISVFGERMNPMTNIASKITGYMPQDTALYPHLTIWEQASHFGTIHQMPRNELKAAFQTFSKLLQLPESSKFIKNLSGGEQRRVSLACALINNPKILMLDEPTAGVDALLRLQILNYLKSLSGVTILITTHYLQETESCDKIGVIRNGRLIVEENPNKLLQLYGAVTLEQVVLQLCHGNIKHEKDPQQQQKARTCVKSDIEKEKIGSNYLKKQVAIISSLVKLNTTLLTRNPVALAFQVFLPLFQLATFATIIGRDPLGQTLAVVNQEVPKDFNCFSTNRSENYYSCGFLNKFKPDSFNWINGGWNVNEAINSVKQGDALGVLQFPPNFTKHLSDRGALGKFSENETLDGSTVRLFMDMTVAVKTTFVLRTIKENFFKFVADVLKSAGIEGRSFEIPLKLNSIHGSEEGAWSDYLIPGVILFFIYVLNLTFGVSHLLDKMGGTLERSKAVGVKMSHIIPSYLISGSLIIFFQMALLLLSAIFIFGMKTNGSILLIAAFVYVVAMLGILNGLLLAMLCNHHLPYVMGSCVINSIIMLNSGIIWPIEGVSYYPRIFCKLLPTTLSSEGMRYIANFGSGLESNKVWIPILILFGWFSLFSILIFFVGRRK